MNEESVHALVLQITETTIGYDVETIVAALTILYQINLHLAALKGKKDSWINASLLAYQLLPDYMKDIYRQMERSH